VIPHGSFSPAYPPAPGRQEARRLLDLPETARVLLCFGQIRPYKGIEELCLAFAEAPAGVRLVIAGRARDAALARRLEALARTDARIDLQLGHVPDARVPVLFAAADWAVLPYRRITTSGALILALSFGVPAIVPDVPELLAVAGAPALETFAADADLVPAIRRALAADQRAAARAAAEAAAKLAWGPIAERTAGFMLEVARAAPVTRSDA
jgi:glycosyltransferase involved in cell wall biosynthesis